MHNNGFELTHNRAVVMDKGTMKLQENSPAKEFNTTDVFGNPLSIGMFSGKTVLLSFLWFTGCPVCTLHVYSLIKRKEELNKKNIAVIIVFESSIKTITEYVHYENIPFILKMIFVKKWEN